MKSAMKSENLNKPKKSVRINLDNNTINMIPDREMNEDSPPIEQNPKILAQMLDDQRARVAEREGKDVERNVNKIIAKAEEEKNAIIAKAEKEKNAIIAKAKKEKKAIIAKAKKEQDAIAAQQDQAKREVDSKVTKQDQEKMLKNQQIAEFPKESLEKIRKTLLSSFKQDLVSRDENDETAGFKAYMDSLAPYMIKNDKTPEVITPEKRYFIKQIYEKSKGHYKKTHLLGVGKSAGDKVLTTAAMLRRTITTCISSSFLAAGITVRVVGKAFTIGSIPIVKQVGQAVEGVGRLITEINPEKALIRNNSSKAALNSTLSEINAINIKTKLNEIAQTYIPDKISFDEFKKNSPSEFLTRGFIRKEIKSYLSGKVEKSQKASKGRS